MLEIGNKLITGNILHGIDGIDLYNGTAKNSKGGTELQYQELMQRLPEELKSKLQIICTRIRKIDNSKKQVLWIHDRYNDTEFDHSKDVFKNIKNKVFVSNDQFIKFNLKHGVSYDESVIIRNAINPIEQHEKPKEVINLVYHTTPHRGLEILIPAFIEVLKYNSEKNIHLHVYSSFEIYGWAHKNQPYEDLFTICKNHPNITYHGVVSNEEMKNDLKKMHIFAYPNIWEETSCIAVIEAMSAGCLVLAPDYGALPETINNNGIVYRWNEDVRKHYQVFGNLLNTIIQHYEYSDVFRKIEQNAANHVKYNYDWNLRIKEWENYLMGVIDG